MALWTVEYKRHSGEVLGIVAPENLHFVLNIDEPHTLEFEQSIFNTVTSIFRGDAPSAGPYQTDWALKRDAFTVATGIVTRLEGQGGSEFFTISGQSYLHYLDRRIFPFQLTYSNSISNPSGTGARIWAGGGYYAIQTNVDQILLDILDYVDNIDIYGLTFTTDIDPIDFAPFFYSIEGGDSESILSKVRALSELQYKAGGFDFEMTKNKVFKAYYPEKGSYTDPVIVIYVDSDGNTTATELGFANTGPEATHVLGSGGGGWLPVNKDFPESSAKYRRLDSAHDFGDNVKSADMLDNMTSSHLSLGANPVHEVPITVNANEIENFWQAVEAGFYAYVQYDLGWHKIDSSQKIVSLDCTITNEGDENVAFGLNQYYDRSLYAGYDSP